MLEMKRDIAVGVIGDATRREFAGVVASLGTPLVPVFASSIEELLAGRVAVDEHATSVAAPPEVAVLLESRAGEFSQAAVERLRGAFPLIRLIVVLGSWGEGETRSGSPVPGAWRRY